MKERRYSSIDEVIAEIRGKSLEEIASEPWEGPRLISVDELRAAGALDVPTAWRKSLTDERGLFSELNGDELPGNESEPLADDEANGDVEEDQVR